MKKTKSKVKNPIEDVMVGLATEIALGHYKIEVAQILGAVQSAIFDALDSPHAIHQNPFDEIRDALAGLEHSFKKEHDKHCKECKDDKAPKKKKKKSAPKAVLGEHPTVQ